MADHLRFQTLFHGIANDTVLAVQPSATPIGHIRGMQTVDSLAAPASNYRFAVLTAKLGSSTIQVEYHDVVIDQERRC
jgi:hypothetical protein